jgi:RNA polymerase sigma factor (sigma-70 family)
MELLVAATPRAREVAWEALLARYNRLLLQVSRSYGGEHDSVMDRYAYVLDRIREDNYRRLRSFRLDGPAQFITWLVVVTRRLCLDHHRLLHGRPPSGLTGDDGIARAVRWRLVHGQSESIDLATLPDESLEPPDQALDRSDRSRTLQAALESLEPEDRLLLYLRYEQDLSASRIATAMKFRTVFHVYRRLKTVVARLRTLLEAAGVEREDR